MLRNSMPNAESQRGYNVAFAVGGGDDRPGPGKDRIRNSLPETEQLGYDTAEAFFLERNSNLSLLRRGAVIAVADPKVAAARSGGTDAFFMLGFDIATGLFGDPALVGQGDILWGPGKQKIHDSLNATAKTGFAVSMTLHLGPPPLPRLAYRPVLVCDEPPAQGQTAAFLHLGSGQRAVCARTCS
jgi:hypothetical protein